MNDDTKKLLHEYLAKMLASAEKGADFAIEQAPLVAQEVVAYGRATQTAYLVFFAALLVATAYAAYRFARFLKNNNWELSPFGMLFVIPVIVGFIGFGSHIEPFFKSWFAPRLYLIEYIKDLVK